LIQVIQFGRYNNLPSVIQYGETTLDDFSGKSNNPDGFGGKDFPECDGNPLLERKHEVAFRVLVLPVVRSAMRKNC
jgi:hypothetical protein